jgi:hypothetical protein
MHTKVEKLVDDESQGAPSKLIKLKFTTQIKIFNLTIQNT